MLTNSSCLGGMEAVITYVDKIYECITDTSSASVATRSFIPVTDTHLQSFAKSMRKYMKSYFPQLESSIIRFSIAWSTLFGIFRSMICQSIRGRQHEAGGRYSYRGADINSLPYPIYVNMIVVRRYIVIRGPINTHCILSASIMTSKSCQ